MPVSIHEILHPLLESLLTHASMLDDEHAVRGIDALNELQLHDLIEDALLGTNVGVHREAHYPSDGDAYTKANHRNRCDFALSPSHAQTLLDPVSELCELAASADTLFAGLAHPDVDPDRTCDPEDALWIEVKVCAQHAYRDGVPSPNPSYANQLFNGLQTDLCKLSTDPRIWHAGVLVVLMCESGEVANHDLNTLAKVCLDQDLPIRTPIIEHGSITDRAGNACLALGFFPLAL